jgi:hypothetical protein
MVDMTCQFAEQVPMNYKENPEIIRAKELENLRTLRQSELEAQYQIELATLRDRQREKDGAAIRETFLEQIRTWYIDHREQNGKFPDLPAEEEGGSKIIYSMTDGPSETPVPVVVKKVKIFRSLVANFFQNYTNRSMLFKERNSSTDGQNFQQHETSGRGST